MKPQPAPTPYATLKLPVGDGHTLHIEEYGNPAGIPVVMVHGGPGGGISTSSLLCFPLQTYRLIAYDQRGCGKSKSKNGPLHANTTPHLVEDIEKIRQYLKIEKWVICGSSWGVALSLTYAQTRPSTVLGLLLYTSYTASEEETMWFFKPEGLGQFFPLEYQALVKTLGEVDPGKMPQRIFELLKKGGKISTQVLNAWVRLDCRAYSPTQPDAEINQFLKDPTTRQTAMLIGHYATNNYFLKPRQVLKGMAKLKHLPAVIIHGEIDLVCPPAIATQLHQSLPKSSLLLLRGEGHCSSPQWIKARRTAAIALAKKLKKS